MLPSFAESFDAAPVIEAGSEDTVVVDGTNNFAIRFEVDLGNGETEVFYHLVNAPDGLASPAPMLSDQSEPLSIQQFYAEMDWQLMATGSLGSYSEAPGGAVIDNTLAPPQFEGIDQGFFSVALPGGGLVTEGAAEFDGDIREVASNNVTIAWVFGNGMWTFGVKTPSELVRATRPRDESAPEFVRELVDWGAGPRAGQFLIQGGKALAAMDGRFSVAIDDVRKIAEPVLRHRISTNFQAQAEGMTTEDVIARLLETISTPEIPKFTP